MICARRVNFSLRSKQYIVCARATRREEKFFFGLCIQWKILRARRRKTLLALVSKAANYLSPYRDFFVFFVDTRTAHCPMAN